MIESLKKIKKRGLAGSKPPGNPIYSSPHRLLTFAKN
jgi:hypothetical protein